MIFDLEAILFCPVLMGQNSWTEVIFSKTPVFTTAVVVTAMTVGTEITLV